MTLDRSFRVVAWRSAAAVLISSLVLGAGCAGDDGAPELADDDAAGTSTGIAPTSGPEPTTEGADESSTGFFPICAPGELRCADDESAVEICADTGLSWEMSLMCGTYSACESCEGDDCGAPTCVGPCQLSINDPSSAGCAFVANRQLHKYGDAPDGLVITNPSEDLVAAVQVFQVPEGLLEEELLESFTLEPNTSRTLELSGDFVPGVGTNLRTGGIFRLYSDTPVISYLHAPLTANLGNESSLLLPDQVLGQDYVIPSYTSKAGVGVSYFEIVALQDGTTVEWTPTVDTQGNGLPIDPVAAGETGKLILNRYETMRIVPSKLNVPKEDPSGALLDLSGTVVRSDKDIWVTGANRMSSVPADATTTDQIQELLFPLQHWGREYVLPSAAARGDLIEYPEQLTNIFRIFAGTNGVTIQSDPPHPDFPISLENTGDWVDIETDFGTNLFISGDKQFLPVQYMRSRGFTDEEGVQQFPVPYGDAAMVQMVPTEQFLSRYVFATGVGFAHNAVQFVHAADAPEIKLISTETNEITVVTDFEQVGAYEVATLNEIGDGTFIAESDGPFGIIQSGHTKNDEDDPGCFVPKKKCNGTYAYPGGMKTETIFTP